MLHIEQYRLSPREARAVIQIFNGVGTSPELPARHEILAGLHDKTEAFSYMEAAVDAGDVAGDPVKDRAELAEMRGAARNLIAKVEAFTDEQAKAVTGLLRRLLGGHARKGGADRTQRPSPKACSKRSAKPPEPSQAPATIELTRRLSRRRRHVASR